jgi:hypothetical protein
MDGWPTMRSLQDISGTPPDFTATCDCATVTQRFEIIGRISPRLNVLNDPRASHAEPLLRVVPRIRS